MPPQLPTPSPQHDDDDEDESLATTVEYVPDDELYVDWNIIQDLTELPCVFHSDLDRITAFLASNISISLFVTPVLHDDHEPLIEFFGITATIINNGQPLAEGCILVYNIATGAKVIERDMDALSAADIAKHWDLVEKAVAKEI